LVEYLCHPASVVRGISEKTSLHRAVKVVALLGGIVLLKAQRRHQF